MKPGTCGLFFWQNCTVWPNVRLKNEAPNQQPVIFLCSWRQVQQTSLCYCISPLKSNGFPEHSRLMERLFYITNLQQGQSGDCFQYQLGKSLKGITFHILNLLFSQRSVVFPSIAWLDLKHWLSLKSSSRWKIMGNPWESCCSQETLLSAAHKSVLGGNAPFFHLPGWAPVPSHSQKRNETASPQQCAT